MKANFRQRTALFAALAAVLTLASSCSERRVEPSPVPTPTPAPPRPLPTPDVAWQDAPITPGVWEWSRVGSLSVARFAGGQLVLRCDPATRRVSLVRGGQGAGATAMTILTSSVTRAVAGAAQAGPPPGIEVTFAGSDPILDALAFSRGRFAIQTAGMPMLYVPSWPEVTRVVEDCR